MDREELQDRLGMKVGDWAPVISLESRQLILSEFDRLTKENKGLVIELDMAGKEIVSRGDELKALKQRWLGTEESLEREVSQRVRIEQELNTEVQRVLQVVGEYTKCREQKAQAEQALERIVKPKNKEVLRGILKWHSVTCAGDEPGIHYDRYVKDYDWDKVIAHILERFQLKEEE